MREKSDLLYAFVHHLQYYNPKIGYRLILASESEGIPTLAFSSRRDPDLRPVIIHLMETAPKLKDWIITASKTSLAEQYPDYFDKEYCLYGICCKPSDIRFWGLCIDSDTKESILGIVLDFPIDKLDPIRLYEVVAIILMDTLGEESYDRHIEDFIVHSQIPDDEDLFELSNLKMYLEGL